MYSRKTDPRTGETLEEPEDSYNHCFVGDTLVLTSEGYKEIRYLTPSDFVLTSNGWKEVLYRFDNGVKETKQYSMQFDTFSLSLRCTSNHKIKTTEGWKEIRHLKGTETLYLHKSLMEKSISYTKERDTIQEVVKDYTGSCGSIIMEKSQKDMKYTMLTETLRTMTSKTSTSLDVAYTKDTLEKNDLEKTQNGQKNFTKKELKQLKNGINQKLAKNGISNRVNEHGLTESMKPNFAKNVENNIKQDTKESLNTAITTAKLRRIDVKESKEEKVYDLMVADCHEYFANGVLVHNCLDPLRYVAAFLQSIGLIRII
jgi:hypothetical protein